MKRARNKVDFTFALVLKLDVILCGKYNNEERTNGMDCFSKT